MPARAGQRGRRDPQSGGPTSVLASSHGHATVLAAGLDAEQRRTAAEDLLELIMRRYERASTVLTSNRPVEDWGKLLGDTAAVTALLDRLLHHAHILKCGPRSWRTKVQISLRTHDAMK